MRAAPTCSFTPITVQNHIFKPSQTCKPMGIQASHMAVLHLDLFLRQLGSARHMAGTQKLRTIGQGQPLPLPSYLWIQTPP